jgi:hypothetical protein
MIQPIIVSSSKLNLPPANVPTVSFTCRKVQLGTRGLICGKLPTD